MKKKPGSKIHKVNHTMVHTRWTLKDNIEILRQYLNMFVDSSTYISKAEAIRSQKYSAVAKAQGKPTKFRVTISFDILDE